MKFSDVPLTDAQSEFGPETPKQDKSQPGPSISRAWRDGRGI